MTGKQEPAAAFRTVAKVAQAEAPSYMWQVVYGHLDDPHHQEIIRGKSYLQLRPGAHT